MHSKAALGLLSGALVVALAGCSSAKADAEPATTASTAASTAASAPAAAPVAVAIKTFAFTPKELAVPVGTTVTWTNQDAILHTVTTGSREADAQQQPINVKKDGAIDAQLDGVGKTASFTFKTAGTFTYFCDRHPGMDARVVVS